jgi:hypothetical protein
MVFAALNRRHLRASLIAGLAALAGLTSTGCVEDQDFLITERAVWFAPDDEACTLDISGDALLTMTADVSFESRIGMGFVVTNNSTPNPNSNTGIDDSEIAIESADVRLSFSGGSIEGGEFNQTMPSNSIPGESSSGFLVQIPTEVVASIRASMTPGQFESLEMEVVFKGRKSGQAGNSKLGEVQTRAFTFPIDVCVGCLASCCGDVCPTPMAFSGGCGFAQGGAVTSPECPEDSGGEETTGP